MPFEVLRKEWQAALAFFRRYPHAIKFSRKIHFTKHSFVKLQVDNPEVTGEIFAKANRTHDQIEPLGDGSYGVVKLVKNSEDQEFALKVEEGTNELILKEKTRQDMIAARKVNLFKGQALRVLGTPKKYEEFTVFRKRYTLLELIPGRSLLDVINAHRGGEAPLTQLQLNLIMLSCSLSLLRVHKLGIIHADVKPENFCGRIQGLIALFKLIDYDFARLLSAKQSHFVSKDIFGSGKYMAPEVERKGVYSFASDVYALGVIFDYVNLNRLSLLMTAISPKERPSLPLVISMLVGEILGLLQKESHEKTTEGVKRICENAIAETKFDIVKSLNREPYLLSELFRDHILNYFSFDQRLAIGLLCCFDVLRLHKQTKILIHVHPQNFVAHISLDKIEAEVFEDKSSHQLSANGYISLPAFDLKSIPANYQAPEVSMKLHFSYASDVYGLGMLLNDLGIPPGAMIAQEPEKRPALLEAIERLIERYYRGCIEATSKGMIKRMANQYDIKVPNYCPPILLEGLPPELSSDSVSPLSVRSSSSPFSRSNPESPNKFVLVPAKPLMPEPVPPKASPLSASSSSSSSSVSLKNSILVAFKGLALHKEKKEKKEKKTVKKNKKVEKGYTA